MEVLHLGVCCIWGSTTLQSTQQVLVLRTLVMYIALAKPDTSNYRPMETMTWQSLRNR
jgi:hypothetical protein